MGACIKKLAAATTFLLVAVVFGGCSRYAVKTDSSTQFAKTSPDAIVVIGLQSARPKKNPDIEGSHPTLYLTWSRLESERQDPSREAQFTIDSTTNVLGMKWGGSDNLTMHAIRLPAGTYMLKEISTQLSRASRLDVFTTTLNLKSGAPYFTVRAGEVRYIGDLHIDAISFPAKLLKLTRTDQLAKAELAKSPGISVAPFFQEPTYYRKGDSSPVPIPVSSLTTKNP